jgi:hypothetical protein
MNDNYKRKNGRSKKILLAKDGYKKQLSFFLTFILSFEKIGNIKTHAYDTFLNVTLMMHQIDIVG